MSTSAAARIACEPRSWLRFSRPDVSITTSTGPPGEQGWAGISSTWGYSRAWPLPRWAPPTGGPPGGISGRLGFLWHDGALTTRKVEKMRADGDSITDGQAGVRPAVALQQRPAEHMARMTYRLLRHIVRSARSGDRDFVLEGVASLTRIPVLAVRDLVGPDLRECNICGWTGREFLPQHWPRLPRASHRLSWLQLRGPSPQPAGAARGDDHSVRPSDAGRRGRTNARVRIPAQAAARD